MEILYPAMAGTLESSDVQVMVQPGEGSIEFELDSVVMNQYGNQIKRVVMEVLDNLEITSAKIKMIDKGALDCTIKARVECAVFRSNKMNEHLAWGGMIK